MPQMAPLNWLFLLLFTFYMFMIINSMNYYSFKYKPKKTYLAYKSLINWKW